ncbi:MAG: phosphatidylglycerophosphatase A [Deltaproteobacteria bacterium]|nr:phosphatidylglycerophosphatase A [Deltaproteobacteria bacterium]MBW2414544.1 phosphatidylglycerophosphatase A [Deltaproteobacteria bacterium]
MRNLVLFVATGAGTGYAPVAPGTFGSALGVGLWWLAVVMGEISWPVFLVGTLGVTAVGIWSAGRAEKLLGKHDDGRITIDEVAGQFVALACLPVAPGRALWVAGAGFLLFRLFDIWKPPPARRFERLPGGLGVVADDLMAGLYANLCGQLLWRVLWP